MGGDSVRPCDYVALPDKGWPAIDATSLVTAAGATSYDRGVQYLREGAVTRMSWDRGRSELYGSVRGSAGSCYETVAYFHPAGQAVLEFDQGRCSCPVGFDCKHVVALVLAAAQAQLARTGPERTAGARPRATDLGAVRRVMAGAAAGPGRRHPANRGDAGHRADAGPRCAPGLLRCA